MKEKDPNGYGWESPEGQENLPCPHGRVNWGKCPHCLGLNNFQKMKEAAETLSPKLEEELKKIVRDITPRECKCSCHINSLKKPYAHDTKCCENMNGYMPAELNEKNWAEEFDRVIKPMIQVSSMPDTVYTLKAKSFIQELLEKQKQEFEEEKMINELHEYVADIHNSALDTIINKIKDL